MRIVIYLLLLTIVTNVSSDLSSSSFCLCTLKHVLEEYALITSNSMPPRYRSLFKNDIGFYVGTSSRWIPVNDATWIELAAMINTPAGMYTRISLDGIHPINNGLVLDSRRSAHLADIITTYRLITDYVDIFHENVIRSRSELCKIKQSESAINGQSSNDKWKQFFVTG